MTFAGVTGWPQMKVPRLKAPTSTATPPCRSDGSIATERLQLVRDLRVLREEAKKETLLRGANAHLLITCRSCSSLRISLSVLSTLLSKRRIGDGTCEPGKSSPAQLRLAMPLASSPPTRPPNFAPNSMISLTTIHL